MGKVHHAHVNLVRRLQKSDVSTMEVLQMMRLLQTVGQSSLATVAGLGDFATFVSRAVAVAPATRQLGRRWIRAVHEQGVRCLSVITVVVLFTGLVLGLQGYYVLAR